MIPFDILVMAANDLANATCFACILSLQYNKLLYLA
jgi:hypothetical protein